MEESENDTITLNQLVYQKYRRKGNITAKIFQKGDEYGFLDSEKTIPYVTANSKMSTGIFGEDYIVLTAKGNKIVSKKSFEEKYELDW